MFPLRIRLYYSNLMVNRGKKTILAGWENVCSTSIRSSIVSNKMIDSRKTLTASCAWCSVHCESDRANFLLFSSLLPHSQLWGIWLHTYAHAEPYRFQFARFDKWSFWRWLSEESKETHSHHSTVRCDVCLCQAFTNTFDLFKMNQLVKWL